MKPTLLLPSLILGALCVSSGLGNAQAPEPPRAVPVPDAAASLTEPPAVLSAPQILIPQLLTGPHHRVRELVPTDGYLAHFIVDSDFGSWEVVGAAQLGSCIGEINAIAKLNAVSRSDIFADGLRRSLEQPVEAAKNVVTHPVETVKALPSTVGHFFKKIGNSVNNAGTAFRNRGEEGQSGASAQDIGRAASQAGKGIIGFENAKLDVAKQLGVDPYTDNPRLREEIDSVAWVFFAGGLPLRAAGMATGAGLAIGATKFVGLPEDMYSATPAELALRNNQAMAAMGVAPATAEAFNNNPALTPSLSRSIIVALNALPGAADRADAVAVAADCFTRQQARFLSQALGILARRQADGQANVKQIKIIGRLPGAVDAGGAFLLPVPSDFVSWTPETAAFVGRDDLAGLKPVVLHTGDLSPLTKAELAKAGWSAIQL